ncbi:MAG: hypothetical protein ACI97A_003220 [Planctomycetota bacterium]|jgi:hypothetical protein
MVRTIGHQGGKGNMVIASQQLQPPLDDVHNALQGKDLESLNGSWGSANLGFALMDKMCHLVNAGQPRIRDNRWT